jgi:hypothetical protein
MENCDLAHANPRLKEEEKKAFLEKSTSSSHFAYLLQASKN